jgi:hypothetical protein
MIKYNLQLPQHTRITILTHEKNKNFTQRVKLHESKSSEFLSTWEKLIHVLI